MLRLFRRKPITLDLTSLKNDFEKRLLRQLFVDNENIQEFNTTLVYPVKLNGKTYRVNLSHEIVRTTRRSTHTYQYKYIIKTHTGQLNHDGSAGVYQTYGYLIPEIGGRLITDRKKHRVIKQQKNAKGTLPLEAVYKEVEITNQSLLLNMNEPTVIMDEEFGNGDYLAHSYIVMDELKGENLSELLNDRRRLENLSFDDRLEIARKLLRELEEQVHDRGIIHLDLKPDNIRISKDKKNNVRIVIFDFGVARLLQNGFSKRKRVEQIGHPCYAPQEQTPLSKEESTSFSDLDEIKVLNENSDAYTVGKVLSELFNIPHKGLTDASRSLEWRNLAFADTQFNIGDQFKEEFRSESENIEEIQAKTREDTRASVVLEEEMETDGSNIEEIEAKEMHDTRPIKEKEDPSYSSLNNHGQKLLNITKNLTKEKRTARMSINEALKDIEEIRLERKLKDMPDDVKSRMRNAHHHGMQTRDDLRVECKKSDTTIDEQFKIVSDSLTALEDDCIAQYVESLGMSCFEDLATKKEIQDKITELSETFSTKKSELDEKIKGLEELIIGIKKTGENSLLHQMLNSRLKYMKNTQTKVDKTKLTIYNVKPLTKKLNKSLDEFKNMHTIYHPNSNDENTFGLVIEAIMKKPKPTSHPTLRKLVKAAILNYMISNYTDHNVSCKKHAGSLTRLNDMLRILELVNTADDKNFKQDLKQHLKSMQSESFLATHIPFFKHLTGSQLASQIGLMIKRVDKSEPDEMNRNLTSKSLPSV